MFSVSYMTSLFGHKLWKTSKIDPLFDTVVYALESVLLTLSSASTAHKYNVDCPCKQVCFWMHYNHRPERHLVGTLTSMSPRARFRTLYFGMTARSSGSKTPVADDTIALSSV